MKGHIPQAIEEFQVVDFRQTRCVLSVYSGARR